MAAEDTCSMRRSSASKSRRSGTPLGSPSTSPRTRRSARGGGAASTARTRSLRRCRGSKLLNLIRLRRIRFEPLRAQLRERRLRLLRGEAHRREDVIWLGELHLVVLHDLDAVARRIAEVEPTARQDVDARGLQRGARGSLVLDDEPEVWFLLARAALEQREELVADLQERRVLLGAVDRGRLEQRGVERDRRLEVVDLQRDVVDARETRLHRRLTITSPPCDSPVAANPFRS